MLVKYIVKGIVQGVGFRPYCARTAERFSLNGYVKNTSSGVELLVEGKEDLIEEFINEIANNPPSAAVITQISKEWEKSASPVFSCFSIEESQREEKQQVFIPSDIAICKECLAEMFDINNRRYRYPFINCTLCGPRYSIIENLPYDRAETTMKKFKMCPECDAEYQNPGNRRFHAQPNACAVCGPRLWVRSFKGIVRHDDPITEIKSRLCSGEIIGIKGIGGFHIACIVDVDVIKRLRVRKNRLYKPFAIMVRNTDTAKKVVDLDPAEEKLLLAPQSPIVVCKSNSPISSQVAPQQNSIGLMLPYTPIHHLIMEDFEMLVMTSANISESPIISRNEDAELELGERGIVDALLLHDRDISMAIDDSVLFRPCTNILFSSAEKNHEYTLPDINQIYIRRARGFVPNPIRLQASSPPILAAGADIKSAFSLCQDEIVFPGQYIGDLRQVRTAEYYVRALKHFTKLYSLKPRIFAHDMHPDYYSTRIAHEFLVKNGFNIESKVAVQHHIAHFASVLLEHSISQPAIGVIFDGIGYGTDGSIWGGELFVGTITEQKRVGHLLPAKMPGADKATEEPWRYALSLLVSTVGEEEAIQFAESNWVFPKNKATGVLKGLINSPISTSCGRLFDGVAALLSICTTSDYEGHAAMALEGAIVETSKTNAVRFELIKEDDKIIIDWRLAIKEILMRLSQYHVLSEIAWSFHLGLAVAVAEACKSIKDETGISIVALSGGVWQNKTLLNNTIKLLLEFGLKPLLNKNLSPNDENISVGQTAVAASSML
jgi:hydrogenase maturation protein HypF